MLNAEERKNMTTLENWEIKKWETLGCRQTIDNNN